MNLNTKKIKFFLTVLHRFYFPLLFEQFTFFINFENFGKVFMCG